jgi:mRNA interferase MazF
VVLLSRNDAYAVRQLVVIAPVTTRIRGIPPEVPLGVEDGLPRSCVINTDVIQTIPKDTLRRRLATLTPEKTAALDTALRFSLGLE